MLPGTETRFRGDAIPYVPRPSAYPYMGVRLRQVKEHRACGIYDRPGCELIVSDAWLGILGKRFDVEATFSDRRALARLGFRDGGCAAGQAPIT